MLKQLWLEPQFHEADAEVRDVDADPCPTQLLRRRDGSSATAERIENNVAFVRRCLNYAFEKRNGSKPMSDEPFGKIISSPD